MWEHYLLYLTDGLLALPLE